MNLKLFNVFTLLGILFSLMVTPGLSARILGIIPTPSYSHQVVFQPLWRELSLRGHQVTVLTTNPMNDLSLTNLTEIDLESSYILWRKVNINEIGNLTLFQMFDVFLKLCNDLLEEQLQHPEVQTILTNETEHFDLLMVESSIPAMIAFSERFKCPFIQLTSMEAQSHIYDSVGNPSHPVLNPDFILVPFSGKLSFLERLISTTTTLVGTYLGYMWFLPKQQELVQKYFGNDYPRLEDIMKNTSMLFVNTDPILHQIRPLLPVVVQIGGGTHLKPLQPLPKDLQKQLDSASQGFIYFSLGSNVESKRLSESTRSILLEAFSELPYTVLWKFEEEDLPGKPDNVIVSKWFPQQDIFRHPNIKLFITQGGLQSVEEALYNHIPMVGMPFFADQPSNVNRMVSKGYGLSLDHSTVDKISLKNTIVEVITNPKYRSKVQELAQLAQDQPMTGLERGVWWTEYVLRHKGAKHLRSSAIDLPLYQYFLLDVIGFCLLVIVLAFYLLAILVKFVFRITRCFKTKTKEKVQ